MKKLIINADDFGWSRDNVDAIIELYNIGVVTSTSVMATMPAFEYGVKRLKENGGPAAGVHLSLFDGKPVLSPERIPGIADRKTGKFLRFDILYKRGRFPKTNEIEAEFRAQIERCFEYGLSPTHFDVHMMLLYYLPRVYEIILKLTAEYGLPMRSLAGRDLEIKSRSLARRQHLPVFVIKRVGSRLLRGMQRYGISHPDYFIPEFSDQNNDGPEVKAEVFRACIENLSDGLSELLTHPSMADEKWRRIEYEVLRDYASGVLSRHDDIILCDYSELSRPG